MMDIRQRQLQDQQLVIVPGTTAYCSDTNTCGCDGGTCNTRKVVLAVVALRIQFMVCAVNAVIRIKMVFTTLFGGLVLVAGSVRMRNQLISHCVQTTQVRILFPINA